MHVRSKYPIRIGSVIVAKDSIGEAVTMTDRMRETFPDLRPTTGGTMLLVKFHGVPECLVYVSQVTKLY